MKHSTFRRQHRRHRLKEGLNLNFNFEYMGKIIEATAYDISKDGIGFVIDKEPCSIIDYEILDLTIPENSENIKIPCRVLYSHKLDASGRKRRYGAHFLSTSFNPQIFIKEQCSKKSRLER